MKQPFHTVTLNMPATRSGELPDPAEPCVKIDGQTIEGVIGVAYDFLDGEGVATVTVKFYARVEGKLVVQGGEFATTTFTNEPKEDGTE